ncbi:MAG: FHA domain-containing protein [Cyanobacteria bacterium P01_C01_bin.120]
MIVCSNCNHQNPDGAVQCEACYTPLPALASCPSCNAAVQSDASFCGQCGFDLRAVGTTATAPPSSSPTTSATPTSAVTTPPDYELTAPGISEVEIPDLLPPEPLIETGPMPVPVGSAEPDPPSANSPPPHPSISAPMEENAPVTVPPPEASPPTAAVAEGLGATQIQINQAKLLHVQTSTQVELPSQLTILHLGKPNDRIPPTIDVSGFPDSEIVSRVHASIRVEGDIYYIEDVGSSNGTYINNLPLSPGNRHRLRPGDRIALGKGDKVTFIFQAG